MKNIVFVLILALGLPAIAGGIVSANDNVQRTPCTAADYASLERSLTTLEIRAGKRHKNAVLQTLGQTSASCVRLIHPPRIGIPGRRSAEYEVDGGDLYSVTVINDMESRSRWILITRTRRP